MTIKIGRFETAAREAVTEPQRAGLWPVFDYELVLPEDEHDPYELVTSASGEGHFIEPRNRAPYVRAKPWELKDEHKEPPDQELARELYPTLSPTLLTTGFGHHYANEPCEVYRPLSYPDLFLQFARLPEDGKITAETVLEWAGTYGVLGTDTHYTLPGHGGPGETVSRFEREAQDAYTALVFYEAATAPQDPGAQTLRAAWRNHPDLPSARLKARALEHVEDLTHEKMYEWCYPRPRRSSRGGFDRGYGFKSLLGAMWLEMFWLLTSEGSAPHCAWCGNLLSMGPISGEGGKKVRKDAKYCRGGACKQAAHRHRSG